MIRQNTHASLVVGIRQMRLMKPDLRTLPESQVQHFNKHGKNHGKIDIPFGYVHIKAISDQCHADQEQRAQGSASHSILTASFLYKLSYVIYKIFQFFQSICCEKMNVLISGQKYL